MKVKIPNSGEIAIQPGVNSAEKVAEVMAKVIQQCAANDDKTEWIYNYVNSYSSTPAQFIHNLAKYVFIMTYFEPDPPTTQIIKTPAATMRTERANCVDYTVLLGAVCARGGLPVVIRCVQLPGQNNLGHVYPIINGIVVDLVQGQDQSGNEYLTRTIHARPSVGTELKYLRNFDTLV